MRWDSRAEKVMNEIVEKYVSSGIEQGMKKGMKQGRMGEKRRLQAGCCMLASLSTISSMTDLSEAEISNLGSAIRK